MGLTKHKPEFRLVANRADITAAIAKNFVNLVLTDATGFDSDLLEITLADNGITKPSKGAELELWLGYSGALTKMGLFVVDEIEMSGWPRQMVIRARGTPFENSKGGISQLQTQKTRVWKRETTLDAMVSKIANEHGLESLVSKSLVGISLPQFEQTAESDISFLVRVGVRYDAVVKTGGGKLVLFKRGDFDMPQFTIDADDASKWSYSEASRDRGGTVVAFWHSTAKARREQVEVGSGEPVKQLRQWYTTEAAALAAAKAELDKRKRGVASFTVTVPGDAKLSADCRLVPRGFHPDLPELFLVTRVTHRVNDNGYVCDVEAELPND